MISEEKFSIDDKTHEFRYESTNGHFFIVAHSIYNGKRKCHSHAGCRENFAIFWHKNCDFSDEGAKRPLIGFYSSRENFLKFLNNFFEIIENKLNIREKTIFYTTNSKKVVIIKLSPFWMADCTRRSLVTLFIRCGAVYHGGAPYYSGEIEASLKSYHLTNTCYNAIESFLEGSIYPLYSKLSVYGFVTHFSNYSKEQIKKMLTNQPPARPVI